MVSRGSNRRASLRTTPWWWLHCPVSRLARPGQQPGSLPMKSVNRTPCSRNRRRIVGRRSQSRSSIWGMSSSSSITMSGRCARDGRGCPAGSASAGPGTSDATRHAVSSAAAAALRNSTDHGSSPPRLRTDGYLRLRGFLVASGRAVGFAEGSRRGATDGTTDGTTDGPGSGSGWRSAPGRGWPWVPRSARGAGGCRGRRGRARRRLRGDAQQVQRGEQVGVVRFGTSSQSSAMGTSGVMPWRSALFRPAAPGW